MTKEMTGPASTSAARRRAPWIVLIVALLAVVAFPATSSAELLTSKTVCKKGNRLAQLRIVSRARVFDDPARLRVITRYFNNRTQKTCKIKEFYSLNAAPQGAPGPQGSAGAAGTNGSQGATGANGAAGAIGAQGAVGPQGDTGAQGTIGDAGATGDTGAQGPQGSKGATGDTGAQGPAGTAGGTGATGADGPQGPIGPKGSTGAQGPIGDAGTKGDTGSQGPQGPTGTTGAQGDPGAKGATGDVGPTGPTGLDGDQGPAGANGITLANYERDTKCDPTDCTDLTSKDNKKVQVNCSAGNNTVLGGGAQLVVPAAHPEYRLNLVITDAHPGGSINSLNGSWDSAAQEIHPDGNTGTTQWRLVGWIVCTS